jgi:uncharacterized protein YciI
LYRIRGVDFLNDPNDLAQFFVGLLPCMFFFWHKGSGFRNLVCVYLPISLLLFGMYMTHSRGCMVALMVLVMVAGRRKLGLVRSIVGAGTLFILLSAAGFAGGRSVSIESGADRMDAWATGLMLIRTHPIFGVGYQRFNQYHEITAHNTVIVCAAELGLVGFFFWMIFTLPTVRDAFVSAGSLKPADAEKEEDHPIRSRRSLAVAPAQGLGRLAFSGPMPPGEARDPLARTVVARSSSLEAPARVAPERAAVQAPYFAGPSDGGDKLPAAEIHRLANVMLISLAGFLSAGWFLSRAYTMTLFLLAGMTAAVYKMARNEGIAPPPLPLPRASKFAVMGGAALILAVWIILRVDHLIPH